MCMCMCVTQGVLGGALEVAIAEENARRSLAGFQTSRPELGWHWPWDRKKKRHNPHRSNPNMTFDLDIALESLALTALAYCEVSQVWRVFLCLQSSSVVAAVSVSHLLGRSTCRSTPACLPEGHNAHGTLSGPAPLVSSST